MSWVALKMLIGDSAKYVGLVFGITFSTLLISQQTSIFMGVLNRTTSQINDVRDADLWVMDPRVSHIDEIEPLPQIAVSRVRSVSGVAWAAPFYKGQAVAKSRDGLLQQVILLGIDDATLAGGPQKMVLGSIADLKQPDAMIIDKAGFHFLWPDQPLTLGKELEINDRRAVIVGICDAAAPFVTFPIVYTRFTLATRYAARQRNLMSFVLARSQPGSDRAAVCAEIAARTGLRAMTRDQFRWSTIWYYLRRTGISVNFGITITLGFIVGAAIAGQTFYLFVVENMKQYGALKAIGVNNLRIVGMVLLQAAVVGLVGFGIGIGIAAAFFEFTARHVVNLRGFILPWQVMVGAGAAVLLICLVVSVVSIRRVLVLDPAVVFRG